MDGIAKKDKKQYDCPISKEVSEKILRLPFFNDITNKELNYITKTINDFKI